MMEKAAAPHLFAGLPWKRLALTGALLIGAVLYQIGVLDKPDWTIQLLSQGYPESSLTCPQVSPLFPSSHARLDAQLDELYHTDAFKLNAYKLLGGAVRIPSESYDDLLPVGQDPRWDVFQDLHDFLESAFPRIHSDLKVTKVNTYGLVLHWQGSESALKPILLAAHQDVVPVDWSTVNQWMHPPYSGHFDGTWIWGRGSGDDKADLISQLIAVNSLLQAGFNPRRTIVLAFGIDEEAAGTEGAGKLAIYLEETYGKDGFALLLDEGEGYGENAADGVIFALPGISEKGYIDVKIEVLTPGGHSSVPPVHTSIGLLSMIIVEIEKHPHRPKFVRSGAGLPNAQCAVAYGGEKFLPHVKVLAHRASFDDGALERFKDELIKTDPFFNVLLKTTQAVNIIQGGVKVNALPELASVIINHRIAEHSSTSAVQEHLTNLVLPVAAENNLTVIAFGRNVSAGAAGQVILSDTLYSALEPSPVSPVKDSAPYGLLSGTIKSTLQSASRYRASDVAIAPSLGLGNTDTRFYWNLTRHIFRYSHRGDRDDLYNGLHTVNEAVRGESIIEQIRFFTKFILNCDESKSV
ncbi:gly-x carboxypeptidase [Moniliophthora roreri MCA 2997]|uniref:Gly-x carboxypeptidase n=1 Tax=Moniliophthora roreri (strain MCA 2997) TaxID=1381753 RepID=V2YTA8_MONRO|nr:gly-x carboxypeptidase [Moniliophthora roreri MCA 2997]KAI3619717.1 gly-x carboxypeptidase [Moniliophthora roreri]